MLKRKIFCFFFAISFMLQIMSMNAFALEDLSVQKDNMEKYINLLTYDGGEQYVYAPFEEYNYTISSLIGSIDYDKYTAEYQIDKLDLDMIWKDLLLIYGTDAYTQEDFEVIFEDLIVKLSERTEYQEAVYKKTKLYSKLKEAFKDFEDILEWFDTDSYVSDAYMVLCEKRKEIRILLGDDDLADQMLSTLDDVNTTIIMNYEVNARNLNALKDVVYRAADEQSDKTRANAMINAFVRVYNQYCSNASNQISKYASSVVKRIEEEVVDQAQAVIVVGLAEFSNIVAEAAGGLFKLVKFALIVKDGFCASTGMHDRVTSTTNLNNMFLLTLALQKNFTEEGKKCLSDGDFSDEEYEKMSTLFNLCKGAQSLNYHYADYLDTSYMDIMSSAGGIIEDDYGFVGDIIDNNITIERYLAFHKNKRIRNIADSGRCGETLYWEIDGNGILTIFGNGEMFHSEYSKNSTIRSSFPAGNKKWDTQKVKEVIFESDVKSIGNSAFDSCVNLKNINIPSGVTTIGSYAFFQCANLESVSFSEGLNSISYAAFAGCSSLDFVELPDTTTEIGLNAFAGSGLKDFDFPNGVTTLTSGMLQGTKIKNLIIPENIICIEANFFFGMEDLENVYMLTENEFFECGVNDMSAGYAFTVYGYENAEKWVEQMNQPSPYLSQVNFINYELLTDEVELPKNEKNIDFQDKIPVENSGHATEMITIYSIIMIFVVASVGGVVWWYIRRKKGETHGRLNYCENCGCKLDDGSNFCQECGKKIN